MFARLPNLLLDTKNFFSFLFKNTIFLTGLVLKALGVLLLVQFNNDIKILELTQSFFLELLFLFILCNFITDRKSSVIKFFWLNPIFIAFCYFYPIFFSSVLVFFTSILFLSRHYYLLFIFFLVAAGLISPNLFLIYIIAGYLFLLGIIRIKFFRDFSLLLILAAYELALFYEILEMSNPALIRLIILFSYVISSQSSHLNLKNISQISFILSSILFLFNSDSVSYILLVLLFYFFCSSIEKSFFSSETILLHSILIFGLLAYSEFTFINEYFHMNKFFFFGLLIFTIFHSIDFKDIFSGQSYSLFISGDSGVGKDTVASSIINHLNPKYTNHISGDDFHKFERNSNAWTHLTHLNPKANNLLQKEEKINTLLKNKTILHKTYDHKTGKFTSPKKILPRFNLVISGLHSQYIDIEDSHLTRCHLSMDSGLNKFFKAKRDFIERGKPIEDSFKQHENRRDDADEYIDSQKKLCNLIIKLSSLEAGKIEEFSSSHKNITHKELNDLSQTIGNSLFYTIYSDSEKFIDFIYDLLFNFSLENKTLVSLNEDGGILIRSSANLPSLKEIRKILIKQNIFNFSINVFDNSNNLEGSLDIPSLAVILSYYFRIKYGAKK